MTPFKAAAALFAAGYDQAAIRAMLAEAEKFPGRWAYAADRRRCVVKHMPAGEWEVVDCEESENRIRAARGRS